ncbi:response regulator transcription factor, partial [bacterium]
GMEAAELLPEDGPLVVLCTAHAEHAVTAFERGAVDYLLKPAEAGRLKKALGRVRERLAATAHATATAHAHAPGTDAALGRAFARLTVPTRGGIVLLDPKEISHATLDGELVTIVTPGQSYLSDATMADLQDRLPSSLFARVHRRQLLNLEHVVRLEPQETGGYLAHTRSGHAVEISRQAARELRKRLNL